MTKKKDKKPKLVFTIENPTDEQLAMLVSLKMIPPAPVKEKQRKNKKASDQ